MPCPYFFPDQPLETEGCFQPRSPLGRLYRGACHAAPPPAEPAEGILRECCNTGYARGRCPRFPTSTEVDAIRFSIPLTGAFAWPEKVQWIAERQCFPVEHALIDPQENSLRGAQARAFLESFHIRETSGE